ncbi:nuclear transport factor 2 family protein [Pseudanabaena sp. FACHB-2040]|uniref:nuclear transport factor 2 family protein n=1 Tax=Pseudanabaena sp. FACHB-2040 TaxID=2692859 RepID=UPI001684E7B0|nr:nuclear transport factor 2 family protein [Pseudanabaena sp. FACHB-2040]MBD2259326.1 nuclear transport factor 2 family protein [Pseudanabaena sp. FACHB-2040]
MKSVVVGALIMALAPAPAFAQTEIEQAAITVLVESIATLADQENFESLEALYADEVQIDYTSLFGGAAQTHTPESLMTAWANVLPGFDQTRHSLSNVQVEVNGSTATTIADVVAIHYLGDSYWQVSGQYVYRLAKEEAGWQVTEMAFNLENESGDRTLLDAAAARVATDPVSYLQRQQTEQAVRNFLTSLENKDMEAFAQVWAEDAVQDMPYSPEGFPRRVEGRENLIRHYAGWPETSGQANFTRELVFYPMQDPTMVFAEWHGVVEIVPTGRTYDQRYGGLFHVVDGKIVLFREYYDPIVFKYAFGLEEGENFGNSPSNR